MFARKLSEAQKKRVAGKQFYKCANESGKQLIGLSDYDCPLWKIDGNNRGSFDESGYHIDHIIEHCLTGDDSEGNLQALCKMCHDIKTKRFMDVDGHGKNKVCEKNDTDVFTCKLCDKVFSSNSSLYRHVKYVCKSKKEDEDDNTEILERLTKLEEEIEKIEKLEATINFLIDDDKKSRVKNVKNVKNVNINNGIIILH